MSHIPERKEKDCLNCGTIVQGHYCHNCGQENVVTKETFWHMVTHFFYDITHFDSNFFSTIHHLILKPGFLTQEYMQGRRARYLHPIKMYVFTSAIFFLIFFSFFSPKTDFIENPEAPLTTEERQKYVEELQREINIDSSNLLMKQSFEIAKDTSKIILQKDKYIFPSRVEIKGNVYRNQHDYDSIQASLPPGSRDGWLNRLVIKKTIDINTRYNGNSSEVLKKLMNDVLHKLPYMLFVSLPLFALILRLIYIRRRKEFFFADHGIFTIHLYVFSFLLLLAVFIFSELETITGWGIFGFLIAILFLLLLYYLYRGMKFFYKQRSGKTFIKFILVSFLSFFMMIFLFAFFIVFSVFTF